MKIWAKITTRFESLHHWPEAEGEVEFLKYPHRHEFHTTLWVEQHHHHRDVEYITLKRQLNAFLREGHWGPSASCESLASMILEWAQGKFPNRDLRCEVTEDGENGALLELE